MFRSIFFPQKGTLTLTPGMGGEDLGLKILKHLKKTVRTKIVHTSGTFSTNLKKRFIYTENDNEFDKRIKQYQFIIQTHQKYKHIFPKSKRCEHFKNQYFLNKKYLSSKWSTFYAVFYGIIHIFVYFVYFRYLKRSLSEISDCILLFVFFSVVLISSTVRPTRYGKSTVRYGKSTIRYGTVRCGTGTVRVLYRCCTTVYLRLASFLDFLSRNRF